MKIENPRMAQLGKKLTCYHQIPDAMWHCQESDVPKIKK